MYKTLKTKLMKIRRIRKWKISELQLLASCKINIGDQWMHKRYKNYRTSRSISQKYRNKRMKLLSKFRRSRKIKKRIM